jgi:malate dehydrogenase (oxaloacetate-decarboxylating)
MSATGKQIVHVALRGDAILTNPRWNKGTAFTMNERMQFGLVGRLPYQVNTLDQQCQRAYDQLSSRETPLRKNSFLQSLKDQNSVLFYQLLLRHLKELMPIVYTPTEARGRYIQYFLASLLMTVQADAIANYSHLFRRSEGLYLSFSNQESIEEDFLEQIRGRDIDLVVCSDSEAILGIGDQGVGVNLSIFLPDAIHEQLDLSRVLGYLQSSSFLQR